MRRQKLVDTARNLFIENGFHATGIAQIAQQSGIAVGQIYRDFSSKEEIVAALVKEDCAHFMASATLQIALAAGDKAGVLAWLHHFVEPSDDIESDRLFAEIVAESARNPRIAAIFTTLQDELRGEVLDALALLAPDPGNAAKRGILADTIMTFSIGILNHRLFRPTLDLAPLVAMLRTIISDRVNDLRALV
jgi:AcrR family transcriptional regulator